MPKRTIVLLIALGFAVLLSVALTGYRTLVLHDFVVTSSPAEEPVEPTS